MNGFSLVIADILAERQRQDEKWGIQNHDSADWHLILVEEVGKAARAILRYTFSDSPAVQAEAKHNLREELVQAAAVAVAWLECLDRRKGLP